MSLAKIKKGDQLLFVPSGTRAWGQKRTVTVEKVGRRWVSFVGENGLRMDIETWTGETHGTRFYLDQKQYEDRIKAAHLQGECGRRLTGWGAETYPLETMEAVATLLGVPLIGEAR
jgi:hypothetical protein